MHTLGALFLGGATLDCEDAADTNDDGGISISDAVTTLGALFIHGRPLPPPSRSPGVDPTPDGLGCR